MGGECLWTTWGFSVVRVLPELVLKDIRCRIPAFDTVYKFYSDVTPRRFLNSHYLVAMNETNCMIAPLFLILPD